MSDERPKLTKSQAINNQWVIAYQAQPAMPMRGLQGALSGDERGINLVLMRTVKRGGIMRKSIKDDEIYGPIRAKICDAYIVAGKPKPERNWLYSRLVKVTLENQELEMLFDLQHSRVTEATKLWQAAHDKPDILPDLGTLVEWLMGR